MADRLRRIDAITDAFKQSMISTWELVDMPEQMTGEYDILAVDRRTCDLCDLYFPHAKPNPAVAEGRFKHWPVWVYVCEGHRSYVEDGTLQDVPELVEVAH